MIFVSKVSAHFFGTPLFSNHPGHFVLQIMSFNLMTPLTTFFSSFFFGGHAGCLFKMLCCLHLFLLVQFAREGYILCISIIHIPPPPYPAQPLRLFFSPTYKRRAWRRKSLFLFYYQKRCNFKAYYSVFDEIFFSGHISPPPTIFCILYFPVTGFTSQLTALVLQCRKSTSGSEMYSSMTSPSPSTCLLEVTSLTIR